MSGNGDTNCFPRFLSERRISLAGKIVPNFRTFMGEEIEESIPQSHKAWGNRQHHAIRNLRLWEGTASAIREFAINCGRAPGDKPLPSPAGVPAFFLRQLPKACRRQGPLFRLRAAFHRTFPNGPAPFCSGNKFMPVAGLGTENLFLELRECSEWRVLKKPEVVGCRAPVQFTSAAGARIVLDRSRMGAGHFIEVNRAQGPDRGASRWCRCFAHYHLPSA